jgi:hypothetical protein
MTAGSSAFSYSLLLLSLGASATVSAQTAPSSAAPQPAPDSAPAPVAQATPDVAAPVLEAAKVKEEPGPVPPTSTVGPSPLAPTPPETAPLAAFPPTPPQLKLESANGNSIRFGVLWQGQYEAHGSSSSGTQTQNLSLRRFSILLGGTVLNRLEYFFDTDFPDLLKAPTGDQGQKNGPGISTKDAFVTYRAVDDAFKIDAGLMLPAGTHNWLQGAGSLYGWDFFLNSYRYSNGTVFGSTGNPYGRDVGVQLRGLVLDGLLEYRAGVFQGKRNPATADRPASVNSFRYAARVQLNFLDPETGYFYGGTYLGKKKIFSVGASIDAQHENGGTYRSIGGDALLDVAGVTAQADLLYRDGKAVIVLPKQTALMLEAGYRFDAAKLSPIARFERRWDGGSETDVGGGLAYWAYGHTSNLKAFYTRLIPDGTPKAYGQLNLQWQVYFY